MKRILALFLAAAPMAVLADPTSWNVDPAHSNASFTVRHLVISNVRGEFQKMSGAVKLDDKDLAKSSVEATIDTASIDTRIPDRDKDLKSPDFFDVRTHPRATFTSTSIKPSRAPGATHEVTGNLTLHGVTKPVTVPVKVKNDAGGVTLEGTFTLQREEFKMTYGKGQVNNDVTVKLTVKAAK